MPLALMATSCLGLPPWLEVSRDFSGNPSGFPGSIKLQSWAGTLPALCDRREQCN